MSNKANLIALAISVAVFAACCLVMSQAGPQLNSEVVVYPLMVVWGLSAIVWPFFAVRAARIAFSEVGSSLRRARQSRRGGYY